MQSMDSKIAILTKSIELFCEQNANAEFNNICLKVIGKLARKKICPLANGSLNVWAAAIIHAVGNVNFVFDKSAGFQIPLDKIALTFGCASNTITNRSKQIRDLLKMKPLDPVYAISANRNCNKASYANFEHSMNMTVKLIKQLYNTMNNTRASEKPITIVYNKPDIAAHNQTPTDLESEYAEILAKLQTIGPTKAIERSLRSLIKRHPDFAQAYESLAHVLEYQGLNQEASEYRKNAEFMGYNTKSSIIEPKTTKSNNVSTSKKRIPDHGVIFQLKITLARTHPPVWRRIEVRPNITLSLFHNIIQCVMGWSDCHLHSFTSDKGKKISDESFRLKDVLPKEGSSLLYTYDFGDDWEHKVLLEKVSPEDPERKYPRITAGKKACPPEDCGGVYGYAMIQQAFSADEDSVGYESDEILDWLASDYDPDIFDLTAANQELTIRIGNK